MRKFSITVLASSLRHIASISRIGRAVGELELDQLAGADVLDTRKAEPFERMVDGLALRVEDAGFQSDENARFHGCLCCAGW